MISQKKNVCIIILKDLLLSKKIKNINDTTEGRFCNRNFQI